MVEDTSDTKSARTLTLEFCHRLQFRSRSGSPFILSKIFILHCKAFEWLYTGQKYLCILADALSPIRRCLPVVNINLRSDSSFGQRWSGVRMYSNINACTVGYRSTICAATFSVIWGIRANCDINHTSGVILAFFFFLSVRSVFTRTHGSTRVLEELFSVFLKLALKFH